MHYKDKFFEILLIINIMIIFSITIFASPDTVNLDVPYTSYTFDYWGDSMPSPMPYLPDKIYDFSESIHGGLNNPQDLYVSNDNKVFIADTGNNRVLCLNEDFEILYEIQEFNNNGKTDTFNQPFGIFVDEFGDIYVADTGNQRIVKLDNQGELLDIIGYPVPEEEGILTEDFNYKPIKIVVDKGSRLFVLSEDAYEGLLQFDKDGKFQGFIGAPKVTPDILDIIWKRISTEQQQDRMALTLPTEYFNVDIDERGFIYATVSSTNNNQEAEIIRKLNPSGEDVLRRKGFWWPVGDIHYPDAESDASITGPSLMYDITVQEYGIYSALDNNRGRVFTYDNNGNLLFVFGYNTEKYGALINAKAIDMLGDKILIIDSEKNFLNVYRPTEYASSIISAIKSHYNGNYKKSTEMWHRVLKYNLNYDQAYSGIAMANLRQDNFEKAMANFKLGNNRPDYSEALSLYRRQVVGHNFGWIVTTIILFLILKYIYKKVIKNKVRIETAATKDLKGNKYIQKIKDTLKKVKYSLYIVFHPFDGFWDLKHEKRGSISAAIIILLLVCSTYVFMRQYTGFIFNHLDPSKLNLLMEFVSVIIPFMLWCIVNWSLTTLVEGKGKFKDIFIASAYALTPIILINIPLTILSNFLTIEEGAFYYIFMVVALVWTAYLMFFGIMVTHRFDMRKNFFTTMITIIGMLFVIFLSVLFFNLVEQVYTFVSEIYHEVIFRM